MSDPKDLWGEITAVPRPSRDVAFPRKFPDGKDRMVAIQVLTQEEQMVCAAAAEDFARKTILRDKNAAIPKGDEARQGYDDIYKNEGAIQVLFRACRRIEDHKMPAFPSPGQMRTEFSVDEVAVLFDHYLTTQAELGPVVARMSKEEVDAFVERLMASGDRFPLDLLSPGLLKTLLVSMASRLHSLLTASSSPGSPRESDSSTGD